MCLCPHVVSKSNFRAALNNFSTSDLSTLASQCDLHHFFFFLQCLLTAPREPLGVSFSALDWGKTAREGFFFHAAVEFYLRHRVWKISSPFDNKDS